MSLAALTPEQELWQSVVFTAFMDATRNETENREEQSRREADRWIRGKGRDFRQVCSMAGMDPDFLSAAYIAGKVDPALLRCGERCHKAQPQPVATWVQA